jgi:hypothetical protein
MLKPTLLMMSNYFHDFAVALLISNLVLFYVFTRALKDQRALSSEQLDVVVRIATWVTVGCLVWIAVGGVIRTVNYRDFEWVEAAGKGQLVALGIKHAVMGACTFAGLFLQWRVTRDHRRRQGAET